MNNTLPVIKYIELDSIWNYSQPGFIRNIFEKYCILEKSSQPDILFTCSYSKYTMTKLADNLYDYMSKLQEFPLLILVGESHGDYKFATTKYTYIVGCDPNYTCQFNAVMYVPMYDENLLECIEHRNDILPDKFACYTIRNIYNTDGIRNEFITKLAQVTNKEVINGSGICGETYRSRIKWAQQYKFNICMENTYEPYYHTEKLILACTTGIPVYYGADDDWIWKIFNKDAFVFVKDVDEAILEIIELDNDPVKYKEKFYKPIFTENGLDIIKSELDNFDFFIKDLINKLVSNKNLTIKDYISKFGLDNDTQISNLDTLIF